MPGRLLARSPSWSWPGRCEEWSRERKSSCSLRIRRWKKIYTHSARPQGTGFSPSKCETRRSAHTCASRVGECGSAFERGSRQRPQLTSVTITLLQLAEDRFGILVGPVKLEHALLVVDCPRWGGARRGGVPPPARG